MSATVDPETRPSCGGSSPAGCAASYDFPDVTERRLPNGLSIRIVEMPGRPLVSAILVIAAGVAEEPPDWPARPSWPPVR